MNSRSIVAVALLAMIFAAGSASAETITVTTSADVSDVPSTATIADLPGPDGVVSFREALDASDNTPGRQTIGFAIPESDWYLPNIYPGLVLLQGSFSWGASEPVTIDGTTQTAFTGDTNPDGNELVIYGLSTYLGGDGTIVTGLHGSRVEVSGSNSEIYGNTGGIYIVVYFGSGSYIHDNEAETIKVDQSNDNVIVRNTTSRVRIDGWFDGGFPATNNRIGGPDPADRNFITGWGNVGEHGVPYGTTVELFDTLGTLVENNYIGTTPDGLAIGNNASTVGIGIENQNHDMIIRNNLIGIHSSYGGGVGTEIYIQAYGGYNGFTSNINIYGNTLGLDANGNPLPGGGHGVVVSRYAFEYAEDVRIGGPNPGEGNIITGNVDTAILMYDDAYYPNRGGIRVSGNSIYGNGNIGIDLMPDTWTFGPTLNDPMDPDPGANGLQNFPDVLSAMKNGSEVQISGELDSEPLNNYTLEFYASSACDPSGFGEGEVFLGSTSVVTDASGLASYDVSLPASSVPAGWVITATATLEPIGATSEFSNCKTIQGRPLRPFGGPLKLHQ